MLTCADFPEVECCEKCHAIGWLLYGGPNDDYGPVCCEIAFRIENYGWVPPGKDRAYGQAVARTAEMVREDEDEIYGRSK